MKRNNAIILMVDDDEEDRLLLKDAFDELNCGDCIHFENHGEGAIKYLHDCVKVDSLPYLIILDLNMPRLNGRQTLRLIKQNESLKNVSVVIFSTSLNPIERDECLALGADSYVVKPASYRESVKVAEKFYQLSCDLKKKVSAS